MVTCQGDVETVIKFKFALGMWAANDSILGLFFLFF